MKYFLTLLFLAQPLAAQTLGVIHERRLWGDGAGTIEITDDGLRYESKDPEESRFWLYRDIQNLDRISSKEFVILSYEDHTMYLGRDKSYHFIITEGELTDELFRKISERMEVPVTDRQVPGDVASTYTIPVKHLHTFGGCEGTLEFSEDSVIYDTGDRKDARVWKLDRDIQSIWSADRYRLEIHAYENNRREFNRTRVYNFVLKSPLDPDVYRKLKLRMYDLEGVHNPIR